MRIGINALYLLPGRVGGTEIYLRSILPALVLLSPSNEFVVFLNRETSSLLDTPTDSVIEVHCGVSAAFRPARIVYEQTVLPVLARRYKVDVLLNAGFTAPLLCSTPLCPVPMVTAVHDLQHKIHPEFFRRLDLPFWNLLVWAAVSRSSRILTFSTKTSEDLVRLYGVPAGRIAVAPHGVDPTLFDLNAHERSAGRMLLAVSTLHPHKNLDRLLEAFAVFHQRHPDYRLVLAGARGFAAMKLEQLRDRLNLRDSVTFTGWIPREELYSLYASARGFIYPSLFEGFGMPVAEALAAGIPTACSAIEPLMGIA
ncbi:MAG: glycosyltransferase family 1 protein, partial [Terriglobia bacterium]